MSANASSCGFSKAAFMKFILTMTASRGSFEAYVISVFEASSACFCACFACSFCARFFALTSSARRERSASFSFSLLISKYFWNSCSTAFMSLSCARRKCCQYSKSRFKRFFSSGVLGMGTPIASALSCSWVCAFNALFLSSISFIIERSPFRNARICSFVPNWATSRKSNNSCICLLFDGRFCLRNASISSGVLSPEAIASA